jgi:hypothetical protein
MGTSARYLLACGTVALLANSMMSCKRTSSSGPTTSEVGKPEIPPWDGSVQILSFDDVTEKVWDVKAEPPLRANVDREVIRRIIRRAFGSLCTAEREQLYVAAAHMRFVPSLDIELGHKQITAKLDPLEWTGPPYTTDERAVRAFTDCIVRVFNEQHAGEQIVGEGTVHISYPLRHCTAGAEAAE